MPLSDKIWLKIQLWRIIDWIKDVKGASGWIDYGDRWWTFSGEQTGLKEPKGIVPSWKSDKLQKTCV